MNAPIIESTPKQAVTERHLESVCNPSPDACILTLIGSYVPGFKSGGPLRSVKNLCDAIGGEFHFKILTLDRDLGDQAPYPGIPANRWIPVGNTQVMYLPPGLRGLLSMWSMLRSADRNTVVYVNSFFARQFSILAVLMRWLKLCRPQCLVVAPRGEFSPGAMQLKPRRKCVYLRIARMLGMYEGVIWHASTKFEAADILRHFPGAGETGGAATAKAVTSVAMRTRSEVLVASDLATLPRTRPLRKTVKKPGQLGAVFVSRLSRKKNLSGALSLLPGVSGDISLDIYGPVEDAVYWSECQALIAALPENIRVRYCGEVEHEKIPDVFAAHELFLFPTLGENYGHVILEALASGCPVLISDQTPWRGLEAAGAGWDIPLNETERFRSVLQQCVDAGHHWFAALSKGAAECAVRHVTDLASLDANRRLFQRACSRLDCPITNS